MKLLDPVHESHRERTSCNVINNAIHFSPVQYGPDVIGLISAIFGDFANGASGTSAEVTETAVYLGLEALRSLCEAEVIKPFFTLFERFRFPSSAVV